MSDAKKDDKKIHPLAIAAIIVLVIACLPIIEVFFRGVMNTVRENQGPILALGIAFLIYKGMSKDDHHDEKKDEKKEEPKK